MSLRFLIFPMWIALCLFVSTCLVYTGIKRFRIDRPALIILYNTIAVGVLLLALSRLLDEVLVKYRQFNIYISNIIIGLLIFVIIEFIYIGITTKANMRSKKLIKIAALIVAFSVVPLLIWIVIDLLLQNRL